MNIKEQLLPYFKETDKKFDNHNIHEKQNKLLSKFLITQETVNILESKHNVKNKTKLDVSWFSIFSEYIKSNNIEYTISKFNIRRRI